MSTQEYRIDFSVQRRTDGGDWEEVGFGSSGAWGGVDQAAHMVNSAVQNREWETTDGMPEPCNVDVRQ
jgi:hypothetical protein